MPPADFSTDFVIWWTGALVWFFGGLALTGFLCGCLLEKVIKHWGLTWKIIRAWCHLKTGKVPEELDQGAH